MIDKAWPGKRASTDEHLRPSRTGAAPSSLAPRANPSSLGKLSEVYLGPIIRSGVEGWIAYVAALGFLLLKPSRLFGARGVERV